MVATARLLACNQLKRITKIVYPPSNLEPKSRSPQVIIAACMETVEHPSPASLPSRLSDDSGEVRSTGLGCALERRSVDSDQAEALAIALRPFKVVE